MSSALKYALLTISIPDQKYYLNKAIDNIKGSTTGANGPRPIVATRPRANAAALPAAKAAKPQNFLRGCCYMALL